LLGTKGYVVVVVVGEPQAIYYYFIICLLYIGIGVGNFSRYSDIINLLCRAKGRKPGLIDELKK
jgi:hypothetical protein